jgi:ATP-dependent DNA helicase RecG
MNALYSWDTSEKNEEKISEKPREKFREKTREKTREKIINLILNDNFITTESMANEIGITIKGIEYHLAKLKQQGIIERIGPDKGGHWSIINNSH